MRLLTTTLALALLFPSWGFPQTKPQHGMAGHISNDADFVHMMLMHHHHGIEMAKIAVDKVQRPEVRQLAEKILKGQQTETKELKSMAPAGAHKMKSADGHKMSGQSGSHDMSAMPGMQKGQQHIAQLKAASGADADRIFLTGMTEHHQMAVDMAVAAHPKLKDPKVRQFADKTVANQKAEIAEMKRLM